MSIIKTNARSASALDATVLTGNLPAISGASLTGVSGAILKVGEHTTSANGSQVTGATHNLFEMSFTPSSSNSKLLIYAFITGTGGRNCCSYRQSPFAVRVSTSASQTNGTDVCFGSFGHQMSSDSSTKYNFVASTFSGVYTNSNTTTKYISVCYLGGSGYNFTLNSTTDHSSYSGNRSQIIVLERDAS